MNSVEKVKAICKERKIPISKIEKELGFGNGYIGQLRKGTFPADRLVLIADYLGVTTEFLLGSEGKEKSPTPEGMELDYSDVELLEAYKKADPITREAIQRILKLQ